MVANNSNEKEEERAHAIKKVKREHIDKPLDKRKEKEVERPQVTVAPKTPVAGAKHSCPLPSHPIVLIPVGMPRPQVQSSIASLSMPVTSMAPPVAPITVPPSIPSLPATMATSVANNPFMVIGSNDGNDGDDDDDEKEDEDRGDMNELAALKSTSTFVNVLHLEEVMAGLLKELLEVMEEYKPEPLTKPKWTPMPPLNYKFQYNTTKTT
ncbi:hypothetical protein C0995_005342 [Termitomyces sp. Mi166|nr:hypothetical protein C0995_005342 [Termitomyces sp. Mi166\